MSELQTPQETTLYYAMLTDDDGVIVSVIDSDQEITAELLASTPYAGLTITALEDKAAYTAGRKLAEYTQDGILRPLIDRVLEGLCPVPPGYELVDGELVEAAAPPENAPPGIKQTILQLQGTIDTLQAALDAAESNAYEAVREGLTAIPQPGEPYDARKRYIAGDTATDDGVLYEALRFSRNKKPSESPLHWAVKPEAPTVTRWEDDPSGHQFHVDDLRSYALDGDEDMRKNYRCKKDHAKSNIRKPGGVSDYWEEI